MDITNTELVNALTENKPDRYTVDEMTHSGCAGHSEVQRWEIGYSGLFLWRVMWRAKGSRRKYPYGPYPWERVGFGVSRSIEEATKDGRKAARQHAKGIRNVLEMAA